MSGTTIDLATVATPAGPFTVLTDHDGAVVASGFTEDVDTLLQLVHHTIRAAGQLRVRPDLGPATGAVARYFSGDLDAIDSVEIRQHSGGPFMVAAWTALRGVTPGHPVSYATLADRAGSPSAVRAAGQACARNAIALFVPCHRVLRSDGSIGGYRWGVEVKRLLLSHEDDADSRGVNAG